VGITIDPGPSASTGAITVGHDQTVDLTALIQGLIAPGIAGDTETVTAVSAAHGTASVSNGAISYSAPSTGPDALNYKVTDQYGNSAGGTINVTVDPGPTAGAASIMVAAGATTDLTAYLLGLDKPGIAGDTLTLSGDSTAGTKGTVTLANGLLAYAAPASAGSDGFGYTVADQYGDTASALVTISAVTIGNIGSSSGTVVLGDNSTSVGFGRGTITVVAGNGSDTIAGGTANDTVIAGNGNDTVTLGQGNNTVILGSGNDSVTVGDGNNTITIAGSATSTDTIKAGGGNNTLYLGAGHETVSLGGGNNTLILTTGTYDVSAGHGTNLFEFTGSQALLNLSFASNDELVFRATGFDLGVDNGLGTGTPQPIAASLFSSHTDGTFATPNNRFAYDAATGKLYYDAQGSTPGSTSFAVADLTNHPHLGASSLFFTN
jgi:Ca2+-binding RTX toxin-like protein